LFRETIEALIEVNDLWASRLEELLEQSNELVEQEITEFLRQTTKQEKQVMRKICEQRDDIRQAQLQFTRLQQTLSAQRVEIGQLKLR